MENRVVAALLFLLSLATCVSMSHVAHGADDAPRPSPAIVTLADMRRAAHCDTADERVTAANFPVKAERFSAEGARTFAFDRPVTTVEVIRALRKEGYEPAALEQALAWSAANPAVRGRWLFPVVALGTTWKNPDGLTAVPFISENREKHRAISLAWLRPELVWPGEYRFLGVRKSP